MATIYPGAQWRPITRNYTAKPRARTRGIILHVAASEAASLRGWFNNPKARASSHFYVRRDGTVEQYVDLDQVSWTSGAGSSETIGVETQGMAHGEWTPAQVAALANIISWCAARYKFPIKTMGSSKAYERGVGWHALGVPGTYRQKARGVSQTGGQLWSSAVGKVCPGAERVRQIPGIVRAATGQPATPAPAKPAPAPATPGGYGVDVKQVQRQLQAAGYYQGGRIDGDYGRMTRDAVTSYQRAQRYYPGLAVDGEWGKLTQQHFEWVKILQKALNGWKSAGRIGHTKIDGDYGPFVDRLVKQTIADNFKGAYRSAVRAVFGRLARPVNDGEPGRAFCRMLGIPTHPMIKK